MQPRVPQNRLLKNDHEGDRLLRNDHEGDRPHEEGNLDVA